MPDYTYKCETCNEDWVMNLPFMFPTDKKLDCIAAGCSGVASRRIGKPSFIMKKSNTMGKWFKNETGKELMS